MAGYTDITDVPNILPPEADVHQDTVFPVAVALRIEFPLTQYEEGVAITEVGDGIGITVTVTDTLTALTQGR